VFWRPTLALHGDVAGAVTSLADGLHGNYQCDEEWIDELRRRDDARHTANRCHWHCVLDTGHLLTHSQQVSLALCTRAVSRC